MAGENVAELEPELVAGLSLASIGGDEEADEILNVGGIKEEAAAVYAEGRLDGDSEEGARCDRAG